MEYNYYKKYIFTAFKMNFRIKRNKIKETTPESKGEMNHETTLNIFVGNLFKDFFLNRYTFKIVTDFNYF